MNVDVVLLPRDLQPRHVERRAVVVFDVLRATTSMTAALAAGVREIRVYGDLAAASAAADAFGGDRDTCLLCGESNCLPPPGFDLGNSPGAFDRARHAGRIMLLSTTNGTRAILAARGAARMFAGALVNAAAVARAVRSTGLDVTLLCAGTNGVVAMEDVLGAGAVFDELGRLTATVVAAEGDGARIARRLFAASRDDLPAALADAEGGRNVRAVGLADDIAFAARLNVLTEVGEVHAGDPPVVRAWAGA